MFFFCMTQAGVPGLNPNLPPNPRARVVARPARPNKRVGHQRRHIHRLITASINNSYRWVCGFLAPACPNLTAAPRACALRTPSRPTAARTSARGAITTNRAELLLHCNQLFATLDRVQSYRMKLGDSSLESPVSQLSLSVSTAS